MAINPLDAFKGTLHGATEDLHKASTYTDKMADNFKSMSTYDIAKSLTKWGGLLYIFGPNMPIFSGFRRYVDLLRQAKVNIDEFTKGLEKARLEALKSEGVARAQLSGALVQQGGIGKYQTPESFMEHLVRMKSEKNLAKEIGQIRDANAKLAVTEWLTNLRSYKTGEERLNIIKQEQKIMEDIRRSSAKGWIGGVWYATKEAVQIAREFNTALIETNSLSSKRGDLVAVALRSQILTGVSIHENAEMLRALTHYAFKTKEEFQGVLTIALKLKDGLGLSDEQAARLARTAEMLHTPFQQMADTMATIVENTKLTASEAESMFETLRSGYLIVGSATRETYENIAKLEGILKAKTGHETEIRRLIASMTTTVSGAARAPIFGVRPEMLRTDVGVRQLEQGIARFVERTTRGQQGLGLIQALTNISEQLTGGIMSPESLLKLSESLREVNEEQVKRISGEERWRQQMADTTKALDRLKGMFQAFLLGGLNPIVKILQWISKLGSWFVGILGKWTPLLTAFQIALSVTFGYAIIRAGIGLWSLIGAIRALGNVALQSAIKVGAGSIIGGVAGAAGVGAGLGGRAAGSGAIAAIRSFFPLILPWITATALPALITAGIPIVLGGLALAGGVGFWLGRFLTRELRQVDQAQAAHNIRIATLRDLERSRMFRRFEEDRMAAMRSGDPEQMKRAYGKWGPQIYKLVHGEKVPITEAVLHQEMIQGLQQQADWKVTRAQLGSSNVEMARNLAISADLQQQQLDVDRERLRQEIQDAREKQLRWEEQNRRDEERLLHDIPHWWNQQAYLFPIEYSQVR